MTALAGPTAAESLTGDPLTDELAPLAQDLAAAITDRSTTDAAQVRERAEQVCARHGLDPADAGWAVATVAAAMLPVGVHPRVLLSWLSVPTSPDPVKPRIRAGPHPAAR